MDSLVVLGLEVMWVFQDLQVRRDLLDNQVRWVQLVLGDQQEFQDQTDREETKGLLDLLDPLAKEAILVYLERQVHRALRVLRVPEETLDLLDHLVR